MLTWYNCGGNQLSRAGTESFYVDGIVFRFARHHGHEEKLREESIALIRADLELSTRLAVIQKAMALIFGYTVDHTSRSDDEAAMQMLGIRLFNAAASGVKLALSGYYQTAFHQARDIMETGFLLDYFRTSPDKIPVWKGADRAARRKLFEPVQIRKALDERDGDTEMRRAAEYGSFPSSPRMRPGADLGLRHAEELGSSGRSLKR